MARGRKPKNPADFGKQFEELKKTIPAEKKYSPEVEAVGGGITIFGDRETTEKVVAKLDNEVTDTNVGKSPLEELQELEKKLRACTDETPRDIKYEFFGNEVVLHLAYNNIEVDASIPTTSRYYRLKTAKPYLATAHKMLEVLKEWRGE